MAFVSILLCFLLTSTELRSALPAAPDVQLQALTVFRDSIEEDPLGVLAGWTSSAHHCSWPGISCDPSNTSVLSIYLAETRLRGTISPFLGDISTLRHLDLSDNSFSGEIPPELGNLKKLQILDLGRNFFRGSIPNNICNCTSLSELALSTNNLTGQIPSQIGEDVEVVITYKELDEEEIEETRRRRREAEEDDGEMYDEFGNLKKKFRPKMQQADNGSTLRGSGRTGWEVELGRDSKERNKDRGRDHDSRESSKSRDRDIGQFTREGQTEEPKQRKGEGLREGEVQRQGLRQRQRTSSRSREAGTTEGSVIATEIGDFVSGMCCSLARPFCSF